MIWVPDAIAVDLAASTVFRVRPDGHRLVSQTASFLNAHPDRFRAAEPDEITRYWVNESEHSTVTLRGTTVD